MKGLAAPPPSFLQRKSKILEQLAVPDSDYTDASPKGSVDAGIRDLIDEINRLDGFVTTSSCAGRVSVFVEGRKATASIEEVEDGVEEIRAAKLAGVGGKGGGGAWLFVSHDPVPLSGSQSEADIKALLGLSDTPATTSGNTEALTRETPRLIHFKFEPMILHVLTACPEHAQLLLRCGLQAGFRESGAVNVSAPAGEAVTPMVAIRSMGLSLESLIGTQVGDATRCTVTPEYLRTLLEIANDRFIENQKRIQRFQDAVRDLSKPVQKKDGTEWEDAEARRERKKAEGLRRKAELEAQRRDKSAEDVDPDTSLNEEFT